MLPTLGRISAPLLVAVQPARTNDPHALMRRIGAAGRALVAERVRTATLSLPAGLPEETAQAVILGLHRSLYRFDRYRSRAGSPAPRVTVTGASAAWRSAAEQAVPLAEGIALARDLINTPAEDMGPDELEEAARKVAHDAGLRITVHDAKACRRMGMGAITAVGRASARPPRMIVLEYRGGPKPGDALALCGKGIVFDTGGLDLKSADSMLLMKKDMGGAATLLGVAWAVGRLRPSRPVRFYLAVAENAIGGNAIRPGDVVRALDGTTIEIGNTDAEGRLVLADAVSLAVREKAARIVDAATLTGAALVALGRIRVPLVGNDDRLLSDIEAAAQASGEKVWRFPSDDEYKDLFKSKIADLKNTGRAGEGAGVLTGGLFIGHFAGKTPWAHLDMSPASWSDGAHDLGPAGATGVLVATLTRLAVAP